MRKRIQKISIFLGIFLIIGLCATFFFIHSESFLNWAEKRLVTELEYRLTDDYKASVGNIEGSILGNVTINNVAIFKKDTPDKPAISTGKVVLEYNLLRLLTRKFEVTQLTVTKPYINAKPNADGSVNLAHIFTKTTTQDSPKFDFAIEHIECNNGIIDYVDTEKDIHIEITGVSIDVAGPLNTWKHEGKLRIGEGSFTFNGSKTPIDRFEVDFQILATRSHFDIFRLDFGNSRLVAAGQLPHRSTGKSWEINLDFQRLDLTDIDQFFGQGTELQGIAKGSITANGNPDSTSFAATLSVETPTFSMTQAENGRQIALTDLKIDAAFNLHPIPTFTLKTFSTQIADGTFTGNGTIGLQSRPEGDVMTQLRQLTTSPLAYSGQWDATDIQLIPLLSMFVQLPDFLADSIGRLSGTTTFNGNSADTASLSLDSTIEVTDTVLNAIAFKDSAFNCKVEDGVLKTDGHLDETEIAVIGPFPLAEQDALDIRISDINFDDLMKIVNSADLGGTGKYTAKLASDRTLKGYMEIPNASFNDIPIGALVGNLNYQNGRVFIESGKLTKNTVNGSVTEEMSQTAITGVVDVEGEFPAKFSIIADPIYVKHYPKILLGAEYPVTGEIRGELKLDGTLINLDGSADFSVTEGVAWGIHLDPLTLPLRIEDYNITIPNCEITTRGQKVTLNVSVASNADFDFLLASDAPVNFQALAQAAQISDFPFDGQFDVRVVGILKKPENLDFRIELDFSDITYLNIGRGTEHPLGDASLSGKLVELKSTTGEPDRYDFTGSGFNGQIRGHVSIASDNPYEFEVESKALAVTPILQILHPSLAAVTGTADGRAQITGTVAELAPTDESEATESGERQVYPYNVDVKIDSSQLHYGNLDRQKTLFTNAEQIRIFLKDDEWTIASLSLRASEDKSSFIELTGTFDAKSDMIDFHAKSDGFALAPFAPALGLSPNMLKTGTGHYTSKVTGTSKKPEIVVAWAIPNLELETEVGDIYISDAGGAIAYRNDLMQLEKTTLKLFGNAIDIGGAININSENINNSQPNLSVNAPALELTRFAELIAKVSENGIKAEDLTGGTLGASIDITGTLAETSIAVNAQTTPQQPIRLVSYADPITLSNLRANATLNAESLHIQSVEANGQISDGSYRLHGNASFPTRDANAPQFAIDVSVSQLKITDFVTSLSGQVPPFRGTVSGHAKLSSEGGLHPHQISIIGEVSELNLQGYGINCTNTTPLQFQSQGGNLAVHLPLELKTPEMETTADVNITGTFEAPEITAEWNGDINQMEWNGKVEYRDERIRVVGIELKNRAGTSIITGVVPFNLAFTAIDLSDRFPEQPIDLHFQGRELPLEFFPGIDMLFSEADGTVDIDLALQGTSRAPHITGNVSLEASQLQLKNFHEPIRNMKVKLDARADTINLTELEFDMEPGSCKLQQGQFVLDGLTPKEFTLTGLRFERFPLGSTVQHALSPEVLEEVEGHLSTTLNTLTVPLDSFLTNSTNGPFPHIRKMPSFRDIVAVASAKLSINSVRLAFKVVALDQPYDFQDPQPIQVLLNAGTLTLPKAFILENNETFSVKQTFTDEDRKPEEVIGNVHTIEDAKTTVSIDAESQWSINGEFDTALRFKNFDVLAITRTWFAPYRFTGALSGTLQMSGTSENPKITFRRHKAEPAELYLHDIPVDLRWRVQYQDGKWEISKERYADIKFGGNQLNFSGTLPYRLELIPFLMQLQQSPETVWNELRETDIDGILDIKADHLDILPFVVPGLESPTGTGQIHVELKGTIEAPQAIGAVLVENIGFELPEAGIHVSAMAGTVELTEQGATIKQLGGTLNGGAFSMTGSVKTPPDGLIWENPPTLDLQTSISSSIFEQSDQYKIDLDANPSQFYLQGEFDDPKLTGNLNISGGYYKQNWKTVRDWLVGASVREVDLILDYPILRDLKLDVEIDIADNFHVRSSITGPTDIRISCTGDLIGPIQEPIYKGNVSVLSGEIALIPQTFEFIEDSNSSITNRSLDDFNPELNLSLRTPDPIRGVLPRDESTVDLEIYATFTGTLKNPDFVLSAPNATEVLTHEEIWAFLVRNISFSHALGAFTFNFHRLSDEDARSISAEYQLRENMSIKVESNEKGEYGADFEIKGRF